MNHARRFFKDGGTGFSKSHSSVTSMFFGMLAVLAVLAALAVLAVLGVEVDRTKQQRREIYYYNNNITIMISN